MSMRIATQYTLGGREYQVFEINVERDGLREVSRSYTTTQGIVRVKDGQVSHPDGAITPQ